MRKEAILKENENKKLDKSKFQTVISINNPYKKISSYLFMINRSFICLLLSCTLLKMFQFKSCMLFTIFYITIKISYHLLCYMLFHKFSEVVIFFVRIIYFFDDYIMLCYFFNFLSINFIYTITILKYYLYILQPEVLTLLLIELLAVIITLFLLLKVAIIYIKDSYFGVLFNVKEILIILFWKTIILLSIYIVIFIPIIFYLQVTHFIFYILVSLFLLLIATGVLYKFIYNNFNLELTHFVAILNSFFFEIVIIFMFTITVFNEFILAQYEVGKKGFFYLFDKKAYVDEKTWAHDVINKYL